MGDRQVRGCKALGGGFEDMIKKLFTHTYEEIICLDNLLEAWQEFVKGKRGRRDVQEFESDLMGNLFALHSELVAMTYKHDGYLVFKVSDPKPRQIHKATVRDRVLHRALYRKLYPYFDRTFIVDSFSCRLGKGSHKALDRFTRLAGQASGNSTRTIWVLKGDIKKFFASIDQFILLKIAAWYIEDKKIIWLLERIAGSFNAGESGVGLPLGNLTSQLFSNVYLNRFDQFVKHRLRVKQYIRYADDFVIFSLDKLYLENILITIQAFLMKELRLELHPAKIMLKTVASGVDFLGWVHFPDHRVLRAVTKRRMMRRVQKNLTCETVQSYLGLLCHGNAFGLSQQIVKSSDWACKILAQS